MNRYPQLGWGVGVCAGLQFRTGIPAIVWRLGFLAGVVFVGWTLPLYLGLALGMRATK